MFHVEQKGMKVGDQIKFKKIRWTLVERRESMAGVVYYRYRVHRKYFRCWLSNTKTIYEIRPWRWNFLKRMVDKDPNYTPQMSLWSNCPR